MVSSGFVSGLLREDSRSELYQDWDRYIRTLLWYASWFLRLPPRQNQPSKRFLERMKTTCCRFLFFCFTFPPSLSFTKRPSGCFIQSWKSKIHCGTLGDLGFERERRKNSSSFKGTKVRHDPNSLEMRFISRKRGERIEGRRSNQSEVRRKGCKSRNFSKHREMNQNTKVN